MLIYYCPNCWSVVTDDDSVCPQCGYALNEFHQLEYEQKLLTALHHTVPERRIMVAQILGNLHSERAMEEFEKIIKSGETDYYFMRVILLSIAKTDSSKRAHLLKIAASNPSALIARFADRLLVVVNHGENISEWDRFPG